MANSQPLASHAKFLGIEPLQNHTSRSPSLVDTYRRKRKKKLASLDFLKKRIDLDKASFSEKNKVK